MRKVVALAAVLGLVTGAQAAGFVFVATPLQNNSITNAEQLADNIPNCLMVAQWNGATQSWVSHVNNSPANNFPVSVSRPYMASVTADGIWTLCGSVPDSTSYLNLYQIYPGLTPIMLPLNMTYYTNADQVISSIPQCYSIAYFNAPTQAWVVHVQGLPSNNFAPKVGYPYMLGCNSAGTWPTSLPPLRATDGNEELPARNAPPLRLSRSVSGSPDR